MKFESTILQKLNNCTLNGNSFYVKRDDLIPYSFGGNKARKAFLYFEEIEKLQSDVIVTYGSASSNHCRIVSNLAKERGLPCYIISTDTDDVQTYNRRMSSAFGAKIISCRVDEVRETISNTIEQLKKEKKNPYFIAGGGHGILGTKAYVLCYDEICQQEKQLNVKFDYVFFASGTGTTQAGLVCGKIIRQKDTNIVGISIARKKERGEGVVKECVCQYLEQEQKKWKGVVDGHIHFIDEYICDGYGKYNLAIEKTIEKMLEEEGIPLDPTYTGKAFWGMLEFIKKEDVKDRNVLFIHTGGLPLFFDYLDERRK